MPQEPTGLRPDVEAAIKRIEKGEVIEEPEIRDWVSSGDRELMGLAAHLLFRSEDALGNESWVSEFLLRHIEICAREPVEEAFGMDYTRFDAIDALRAWYQRALARPEQGSLRLRMRTLIASLITSGDSGLRRAVIDGALEHLFENEAVVSEFSDWRSDPELATAMREALDWSAGQPDSG